MTVGGNIAMLILLAAGSSSVARAASPDPTFAAQLSGETSRDWLRQRESVFMGDGSCQTGERWRFIPDGTLRIRRCLEGNWLAAAHRWRIVDQGGKPTLVIEPALTESGRRVLISDDGRTLILRRVPDKKTKVINDVVLKLANSIAAF